MYWKLSDLYEGVDDNGYYDFAGNAQILLDAVDFIENLRPEGVIQFLLGARNANLRTLRYHFRYSAGRAMPRYYWEALMEQLRLNGFLEFVFLNSPDENQKRQETRVKVTEAGSNWMRQQPPKTLKLKAIGQMYSYFNKKPNTPLVGSNSVTHAPAQSNSVKVTKLKNFVCNDIIFEKCLHSVRDMLATSNSTEPEAIAPSTALKQMVKKKPLNMDEFMQSHFDSFSHDKTEKYAPTFINLIKKYKVRTIYLLDFF